MSVAVLVLCYAMFVIPHYWSESDQPPVRWHEIVYAGVHRLGFVAAFIWTGYLSAFKMGGVFRWLYEIKALVPFGRMSSSVFLAHFTFIWYDIPNSEVYISPRTYNMVSLRVIPTVTSHGYSIPTWLQVMRFVYTLFMSWFYSYLIYLLFEAPSMSWAKVQIRKEIAQASGMKKTDGIQRQTSRDDNNNRSKPMQTLIRQRSKTKLKLR